MSDTGSDPGPAKKLPPVFLERQSYRRRRLLDAARLLPVLGALLFAVPLLWPQGGAAGTPSTSAAIRYIFIVWGLLILCTLLFGLLTRGWSGPADPVGPGAEATEPAPVGR
ncbi:hypothetical protein [Pseudodonghicola flavimaris]|uniref:Uncharacterized protein n=1 Tax=Pseudodonghicola flavimaris TaxID=3050036 RepID=A0ABT7EYZ0_9RHOB|nr:hypothetical protein [Pseudodonghicola flavimaris]MDK3017574.1 hypothetical protein [Pseudodonghicola flavimaris]